VWPQLAQGAGVPLVRTQCGERRVWRRPSGVSGRHVMARPVSTRGQPLGASTTTLVSHWQAEACPWKHGARVVLNDGSSASTAAIPLLSYRYAWRGQALGGGGAQALPPSLGRAPSIRLRGGGAGPPASGSVVGTLLQAASWCPPFQGNLALMAADGR
jgi:hypothetical protein